LRTKLKKKLNRNLTQEEDSSWCLKILSQITTKRIRMNWQRSETFCQRKTSSPSTMITNLSLPCHWLWFFKELNTLSSFQNTRASHQWAKTYSAHSLHVYTFRESHCKVPVKWLSKPITYTCFPFPQTGSCIINNLSASFSCSVL